MGKKGGRGEEGREGDGDIISLSIIHIHTHTHRREKGEKGRDSSTSHHRHHQRWFLLRGEGGGGKRFRKRENKQRNKYRHAMLHHSYLPYLPWFKHHHHKKKNSHLQQIGISGKKKELERKAQPTNDMHTARPTHTFPTSDPRNKTKNQKKRSDNQRPR